MKTVLVDADGVVIRFEKNFAQCYSERFNVPIASILEFFEKDYQLCAIGKADIRESIRGYIQKWKWNDSVDSLFEFWYSCQSQLDERVLAVINKARSAGVPCYLATDQDRARANYLLDALDLKHQFDGFLFSCDLGFTKADVNFFRQASSLLERSPGQLILWDDSPHNVTTAREAGLSAELYTDCAQFEEKMTALIQQSTAKIAPTPNLPL